MVVRVGWRDCLNALCEWKRLLLFQKFWKRKEHRAGRDGKFFSNRQPAVSCFEKNGVYGRKRLSLPAFFDEKRDKGLFVQEKVVPLRRKIFYY